MTGSFLPSLTRHAATLVEDKLYIFGGYDRRYNCMTNDIYVLENLDDIEEISCTLIPGNRMQ
jgi:hypothetical protein